MESKMNVFNIKLLKKSYPAFLLLFCTQSAFATGGESSGGGGAFVCLDKNNQVLSAISQDLWNGTHRGDLPPLTFVSGTENYESIARAAVSRLSTNKRFQAQVSKELEKIINRINSGRALQDLSIVRRGDDKRKFENADCAEGRPDFAQAAFYDDKKDNLVISKRIWNAFKTEIDKAGLATHEAVYRVLRLRYEATDSVRAQSITATLLAKEEIPDDSDIPKSACLSSIVDGKCEVRLHYEVNAYHADGRDAYAGTFSGNITPPGSRFISSGAGGVLTIYTEEKRMKRNGQEKTIDHYIYKRNDVFTSFDMKVTMGDPLLKYDFQYMWGSFLLSSDLPAGSLVIIKLKIGDEVIHYFQKRIANGNGSDIGLFSITELNESP